MQIKAQNTLYTLLLALYPPGRVIQPDTEFRDVQELAKAQGAVLQYTPPELAEKVNAVTCDFLFFVGFYAHGASSSNAMQVLEAFTRPFYDYVATISPRSPSPILASTVTSLQERQATPDMASASCSFRIRITS